MSRPVYIAGRGAVTGFGGDTAIAFGSKGQIGHTLGAAGSLRPQGLGWLRRHPAGRGDRGMKARPRVIAIGVADGVDFRYTSALAGGVVHGAIFPYSLQSTCLGDVALREAERMFSAGKDA